MSRKTGAAYYDEDDYDDGYDDDDYGDGYDDYDEPVAGPATVKGSHGHKEHVKPKPGHKLVAPAAAAGASRLAQALSDPPPLRPDGKPQRGGNNRSIAISQQHSSYPLSPPSTSRQPQQTAVFDFSTPSPDDRAKATGPAGRPTVGVALAPSKTPTVKQQQQAAAARKQVTQQESAAASAAPLVSQHSIDNALHDLQELNLTAGQQDTAAAPEAEAVINGRRTTTSSSNGAVSDTGSTAATKPTQRPGVSWRPLNEYVMEPDLSRDVDAALAAEAGSPAGRRGLHLVVMGHVDAGKSTLMGRLLHELGNVTQKEVHKNQKEAAQAGKASFSWAWVLDERPEERARGVTVDVAVAQFKTPGHDVTLLDAPGHRDFVPNMISGAAQADAALLLVDGSPGGFEAGFKGEGSAGYAGFGETVPGGQTQEHAQLARSLGVEQMAVVISKLDTCDYSQERFEYIKSQLLPFLKSVGFRESLLQWLPAVGPEGQNLVTTPTEPLLSSWWKGPTLVHAIDNFSPKPRNTGVPVRIPVHDVYKARQGSGVCVGGKLEAGGLKPGSKVLVVPGYEVGVVKTLEVNGKDHAPLALAGDSADIHISGVDFSAIHAGSVLCHPDFPVHLAYKFTVQTAIVEVTPVRPIPLEVFADVKALGRIALREGGRTIAVGIVTRILE